jgi:hypothetical protein
MGGLGRRRPVWRYPPMVPAGTPLRPAFSARQGAARDSGHIRTTGRRGAFQALSLMARG